MIGAVVKDNIVQNLIVIREAQIPEMEKALGCEIVAKADRERNLHS